MEPEEAMITPENIINILKTIKKNDPLFKLIKKLKAAIEVCLSELSSSATIISL